MDTKNKSMPNLFTVSLHSSTLLFLEGTAGRPAYSLFHTRTHTHQHNVKHTCTPNTSTLTYALCQSTVWCRFSPSHLLTHFKCPVTLQSPTLSIPSSDGDEALKDYQDTSLRETERKEVRERESEKENKAKTAQVPTSVILS